MITIHASINTKTETGFTENFITYNSNADMTMDYVQEIILLRGSLKNSKSSLAAFD
jgi:hypothetical protein